MAIKLPENIFEKSKIEENLALDGNCTNPAGHCYGNDGGSGMPEHLKVAPGRGGKVEAWQLDANKTKVLEKINYNKCQFCGKYIYAGTTNDGEKKQ